MQRIGAATTTRGTAGTLQGIGPANGRPADSSKPTLRREDFKQLVLLASSGKIETGTAGVARELRASGTAWELLAPKAKPEVMAGAKRGLQACSQPNSTDEGGGSEGQTGKKVRTSNAPHKQQAEGEVQIEANRKADCCWWDVVESSIRADPISEAPSIGSGSNGSTSSGSRSNGKREMNAVVQSWGESGCGDTDEQVAKKIRTSVTMQFPIHEVAEEHRLAASDSDEDHSRCEPDNTWWHEVECLMEDDFKIDRDWWDEVDSAIRADEVGDLSDSTAFIVDEPG